MKKILKIQLSIALSLTICFIANINAFSNQCDGIRDKMLRMHVIANSDSVEDQNLKLKVRDAVLSKGKEIFDGSVTADEAVERITPHIDLLEKTAKETILNEGFEYDVNVTVQKEYFKTRTYDNSVTLPAGYYTAVKVVIGEGNGQNWWCIMFPPMCLPAAEAECDINDLLNYNENDIVSNGKKYKFKFKIVEICEEIYKKIK